MEQKQMLKQMVEFNKAAFDNAFNTMVMIQDQTERMVRSFLDQATWLPKEGRAVIEEWAKAYKTGREGLKNTMDDNFKKVEDFVSQVAK
jgi:hypothetical protein